MSYAPPNIDPANLDTLTGAFNEVLKNMIQDWGGMLPASVTGYKAGPPSRVGVQIMIPVVDTNTGLTVRAQVASIPVFQYGGGGFIVNFPLNVGDLGWVIACDRDINLFLQYYNMQPPPTARIKDWSSALFVPHVMKGYSISDDDAGNLVIQSLNGSVKVSLGATIATVQAPTVNVNGTSRVNLAGTSGGAAVARIGDTVDLTTGLITSGSTKVFSN